MAGRRTLDLDRRRASGAAGQCLAGDTTLGRPRTLALVDVEVDSTPARQGLRLGMVDGLGVQLGMGAELGALGATGGQQGDPRRDNKDQRAPPTSAQHGPA